MVSDSDSECLGLLSPPIDHRFHLFGVNCEAVVAYLSFMQVT